MFKLRDLTYRLNNKMKISKFQQPRKKEKIKNKLIVQVKNKKVHLF